HAAEMPLVKYGPGSHERIPFHDWANSEFWDDKEREIESFTAQTKRGEYSRRLSMQLFNDARRKSVKASASIQSHVGVNLPSQNYGYDYQPIRVRCEGQCCRFFRSSKCRNRKKNSERHS